MSLGIWGKSLLSATFQPSVYRKLENQGGRHYVILTYHHVLPKQELAELHEPGMYVTPETFRVHLRFLKNHFNIISLDRLGGDDDMRSLLEDAKPACILTFDDGWVDFYQYAWPILCEEGAPATVFLPTDFIGTNKTFWTDRLAVLILKNGFDSFTRWLSRRTGMARRPRAISRLVMFSKIIGQLKAYEPLYIDLLLTEYENEIGPSDQMERTFINWGEARNLYRSGLVTFGSHTANHAILTTLPAAKIRVELSESLETLAREEVVSEDPPFCYPNGNYTTEIACLVEQTGYSSAFSCDPGWNAFGDNPYYLNRIGLHEDISSTEPLLAYHLSRFI